jgi:hypothetical protein
MMADFIVIPIVVLISLAAWLVARYWADTHPLKSQRAEVPPELARGQAAERTRSAPV